MSIAFRGVLVYENAHFMLIAQYKEEQSKKKPGSKRSSGYIRRRYNAIVTGIPERSCRRNEARTTKWSNIRVVRGIRL